MFKILINLNKDFTIKNILHMWNVSQLLDVVDSMVSKSS
jgi:hypothetical protein